MHQIKYNFTIYINNFTELTSSCKLQRVTSSALASCFIPSSIVHICFVLSVHLEPDNDLHKCQLADLHKCQLADPPTKLGFRADRKGAAAHQDTSFVIHPSLLTSYKLNTHASFSSTGPRSSTERPTLKSCSHTREELFRLPMDTLVLKTCHYYSTQEQNTRTASRTASQ